MGESADGKFLYVKTKKSNPYMWMFVLKGQVQEAVEISWGSSANKAVVSEKSLSTIKTLVLEADLTSCRITSTLRSPAEQASAMFDNLEIPDNVQNQRNLYGRVGNLVIDVYVASKAARKTATQIKSDMTQKIEELLKAGESLGRHCVSSEAYAKVNAIDIGYNSISNQASFRAVLQKAHNAGKIYFIDEPYNSCFHIEITQ